MVDFVSEVKLEPKILTFYLKIVKYSYKIIKQIKLKYKLICRSSN